MKTFKCTLEAEIMVKFTDEEKAVEVFIESDWKNSFYDFSDLEDVARHLSYAFFMTDQEWREEDEERFVCKIIEGFGSFKQDASGRIWTSNFYDDIVGQIIITENEDLGVSWIDEEED